jgi:hypothetical protein
VIAGARELIASAKPHGLPTVPQRAETPSVAEPGRALQDRAVRRSWHQDLDPLLINSRQAREHRRIVEPKRRIPTVTQPDRAVAPGVRINRRARDAEASRQLACVDQLGGRVDGSPVEARPRKVGVPGIDKAGAKHLDHSTIFGSVADGLLHPNAQGLLTIPAPPVHA